MKKDHFSLYLFIMLIPLCPTIMSLYTVCSGTQIDFGYNETKDMIYISLLIFALLFCLFMMFVFAPYLVTTYEDKLVFHYPLWANKIIKHENIEKLTLVKNGLNQDVCTEIHIKDGTVVKIRSWYFGLNKYLLSLNKSVGLFVNKTILSCEEKELLFKQYNAEYKPNIVELLTSPSNITALLMILLIAYRMFILSNNSIIFILFLIGWGLFLLKKLTGIKIYDNKIRISNIIFAGTNEFVISELTGAYIDRKAICLIDKNNKKHIFLHALKKTHRKELENIFSNL